MITATNLKKSYGSTRAVDGISITAQTGETLGLLGPNGAGKTTTISMIVGAIVPDSGSVTIADGKDVRQAATRKLIGYAPQSLAIYDTLSASENLTFFGRLYGLSGSALRDRVQWGLEFAGLTDRKHKPAKTFSGGMMRRLNMACALVQDPQVILMDEPTVGVDPQSRNHIFEGVEQIKSSGRTIIYTTHYMEEAQRLCDRVAIVDHGRLLALDTVENLISAHGGRSVVRATLAEQPVDPGVLPSPPDESGCIRFETTDPLAQIGSLSDRGVRFSSWRVDEPDLETVFLTLTGRSLRD